MLHTQVRVLHTQVRVLHTPVRVLHTPVRVLHTPVRVLHTPVRVLHTHTQVTVLHTKLKLLHAHYKKVIECPRQGTLNGEVSLLTVDLLFDWFGISCLTFDNFRFYLQNRLIQTGQTGGQRYSDTALFSVPCFKVMRSLVQNSSNTLWIVHGRGFIYVFQHLENLLTDALQTAPRHSA